MVQIYTIQVKVAQKLKLTNDPNYLDTTVKSGDKTFAPTWKIVMGVKRGEISEAEYTVEYTKMMLESYQENQQRWQQIIEQDTIILACYCHAGNFCHRYLLKDMLLEHGAEYVKEIRKIEDYFDTR